jgi:multidrug efflux pump subunit AcrB
MALAALVLAAAIAAANLPLELLPALESAQLTVETVYPGLGARDVRTALTAPVEDALSAVKGLARMRSVSRDGASLVTLDFRWGTQAARAQALVREAVDGIYPSLPQGAAKPLVRTADSVNQAHIIIAVTARDAGGSTPEMRAFERDFAEYEMRTRLRRIPGVGSVILSGGGRREVKVAVDIERARGRGLDVNAMASMLSAETADIPAGSAKEDGREIIVVSSGKPKSADEIARLNFASENGPFTLSDVASVTMSAAKPLSVWAFNGRQSTALEVWRQPGSDPVKLSAEVRRAVMDAAAAFERDVDVQIVYDGAPAIVENLRSLIISAAIGAACVLFLLYIFLRNIRVSILSALSIPVSAAASLTALIAGGRSLNGMSLSGLALGIGLVSDTAVVILDALRRAFEKNKETAGSACVSDSDTQDNVSKLYIQKKITNAAAALSGSSFGGTATTVIVFVPVLFLPGPLGALFGDLALSLVASVTAGWLYAQLALPSLFALLRLPDGGRIMRSAAGRRTSPLFFVDALYARMLARALKNPGKVLLAAAAFSAMGAALLALRPVTFRAEDGISELEARVMYAAGTPPARIGEESERLQQALLELPVVENVIARAGAEAEDAGRRAEFGYAPEELRILCVLKKGAAANVSKEMIQEMLHKETAAGIMSEEISVSTPSDAAQKALGLLSGRRLAVKADEPEAARERAAAFAAELRAKASGFLRDDVLTADNSREEIRIIPRREAAAALNLSSTRIAEASGYISEGIITGEMEIDGRPVDIHLAGKRNSEPPELNAISSQTLTALPVFAGNGGKSVRLGTVARIERGRAPRSLARLDRSDVLFITPQAKSGMEKQLSAVIHQLLNDTQDVKDENESVFKRYSTALILTVILVLILLYMTMAAQFESFLLPLIFMLSIVFSLAGAGPALTLAGRPLDSGAVLALVVLFGLVVNNGIVLYETAEQKLKDGFNIVKAVSTGAKERFRPVLITTLTTAIALLPLAFNPAARSQQGMAFAMLGGVLTGTALTLFAMPPVFIWYFRRTA